MGSLGFIVGVGVSVHVMVGDQGMLSDCGVSFFTHLAPGLQKMGRFCPTGASHIQMTSCVANRPPVQPLAVLVISMADHGKT